MNGDLLGWIVGLAVTVLPVAIAAWWGTRRARRVAAALEAVELLQRYTVRIGRLGDTFRAFGCTFAESAAGMARLGETLREADDAG